VLRTNRCEFALLTHVSLTDDDIMLSASRSIIMIGADNVQLLATTEAAITTWLSMRQLLALLLVDRRIDC